jgi:THAP4-like, heme-binding beta-barrel domain
MTEPARHPSLEPVAWLLGTWTGEGEGFYPTIESFGYGEESRFWHSGKPLISYLQRTWSLDDGTPLHSEAGFWRPQEDRTIELVLAHGFGVAEVSEGRVEGRRIEVTSRSLTRSSSANRVESVRRVVMLEGDDLTYDIAMAAAEQPLQGHLKARLHRT